MGTDDEQKMKNQSAYHNVVDDMLQHPQQMLRTYPRTALAISDIERLAKAGVAMTFKDIADQIMPDPPQPTTRLSLPSDPDAEAIYNRWYMNPENANRRQMSFQESFRVSTARHGGIVHVFVAAINKAPVIIEDDVSMFPSDALLAKIHLLLRVTP